MVAACSAGPAPSARAPAVVEVPAAHAEPAESGGALPPRGPPAPPPPADPLEDYVGTWDGLVNDTVPTELVVEPNGRFRVRASPTAYRTECDLAGRFRASEDVVWMDVENSTCTVITRGSSLERAVLSKSSSAFTVKSPDGSLVIRYTRRAR